MSEVSVTMRAGGDERKCEAMVERLEMNAAAVMASQGSKQARDDCRLGPGTDAAGSVSVEEREISEVSVTMRAGGDERKCEAMVERLLYNVAVTVHDVYICL